MTRQVLYVAHPLAPTPEEIADYDMFPDCHAQALNKNIRLALRWLAWLRASFPQDTFIAPWIATALSLHDDDGPELREAGLRDDCAVIERCDGITLTGSRLSSGMGRERDHGADRAHGNWCQEPAHGWSVFDLTVLGLREPPEVVVGMTLDAWLTAQLSGAP